MIGPKISPALQPGDFHLVVRDDPEYNPHKSLSVVKCYSHTGHLKWYRPCLAKGVNGSSTWVTGGDTPPGLYKLGDLFISKPWESYNRVWAPYGKYCFDMVELENQENVRGRAGICLHGGGSACPDPLADYQPLYKTHGCVRMHNIHLAKLVLPLTHEWVFGFIKRKKNTVYLSVWQDRD